MAKAQVPAHGWWGQRWLEYVDRERLVLRLTSSQIKGAERGEAALSFARGQVTARVGIGQHGDTHTTTLKVKPLTDRAWRRVLEAIAARPEAAQRLLSGIPAAELAEAFAAADLPLFPEAAGRAVRCTCREEWGCRHVRVLVVRSAPMLDANPFLWLQVLGRSREDLLADLKARLADRAGPEQGALAAQSPVIAAERFLSTDTDPRSISVRIGSTATPDALLRLLGPVPLPAELSRFHHLVQQEVEHAGFRHSALVAVTETADQVLSRYIAAISRGASELASGDRPPSHKEETLPGKRVPLRHRLTPEVEQVVERAEACISLGHLHTACPTAAALPWAVAERALRDAMAELPNEYVGLAGEYVARRSALLTGASFRHVITFREWQNGRLGSGSDWEHILHIAGHQPPFSIQMGQHLCRVLDPENWRPGRQHRDGLFALLEPEVGDELQLTVVDPAGPVLVGALRRRDQRSQTEMLEVDRGAALTLCRHIAETGEEITWAEAIAVLLGEGFYRDGRCPDPVWLLPSTAVGQELFWGYGQSLTTQAWRASGPNFGRSLYGVWRDRQNTLNQFSAALLEPGQTRKGVEAALSIVEAWGRHWPGDQRDPQHPPTLAALLQFLWSVAPWEARRMKVAPAIVPEVMLRWFRFLVDRHPGLGDHLREHIEACGLSAAYAHRLRTLPVGRGDAAGLEVWRLEGYRWMGPELCFSRGR